MSAFTTTRNYDYLKRACDIALSGGLLLGTAPIQLVIAALIWKKLGRPVFFRQKRPGLGGEVFELVKFRSMRQENADAGLISDEDRLTEFGRFLRSTSLDELPTLWNVLKGDMSMVGPRPLLVAYLERYSAEQMKRHSVRPGITGLAQVRGRNSLSWNEKFALDLEYVRNRSLILDCQIIMATVKSVLTRSGISADGNATMPEFQGHMDGSSTAKSNKHE